ncbi:MAG TPA: hypothetical protein EYG66_01435, partial [Mariprofundaceae bacterium]|nr:hypothetical protein [Mariprofundaceae bacterium]
MTHTALVADRPNNKKGKKLTAQTTNDNNNPNLKHKKLNNSETVVASVQQAPLVTQSVLQKDGKVAQIVQQADKTSVLKQFTNKHETTQPNLQQKPINIYQQAALSQKTENSPAATQPQNIINKSTTPIAIETQPNVSKQPIQNMEAKALQASLAAPATAQKNTIDDGLIVKQNKTPILLNNATEKDQPTSLANEGNTLNAAKKLLPSHQAISDAKITAKTDSSHIASKEPTITKEPLSIQQVVTNTKAADKADSSPIRGKELTTAKEYSPIQQLITDVKTTDKADSPTIRGKELATAKEYSPSQQVVTDTKTTDKADSPTIRGKEL